MTGDRVLRWCARSYARLLWVLRVRDRCDRLAIGDDGERLLEAAHARGPLALATTWLALVWDLVFTGARHDLAQALRALVRAPGVAGPTTGDSRVRLLADWLVCATAECGLGGSRPTP